MAKAEDNKAQLMVQGINRIKVEEFVTEKPYLKAKVSPIHDVAVDDKESKALTANLIELYNKIVKLSPGMPDDMRTMAKSIEHPSILADMITSP